MRCGCRVWPDALCFQGRCPRVLGSAGSLRNGAHGLGNRRVPTRCGERALVVRERIEDIRRGVYPAFSVAGALDQDPCPLETGDCKARRFVASARKASCRLDAYNGVVDQFPDEDVRRGSRSGSGDLTPRRLDLGQALLERRGLRTALDKGVCKVLGPGVCSFDERGASRIVLVGPERREVLDIAGPIRCQDEGHRWDGSGRKARPSQDDMDKGTPGAPIAVYERVHGLELGVSYRGNGDGGQFRRVGEGGQIVHKLGDALRCRGNVCSIYRVCVVSADPVLHVAQLAPEALHVRALEQKPVHGAYRVDGKRSVLIGAFYAVSHGGDVRENGGFVTVEVRVDAKFFKRLVFEQLAGTHCEPLDFRRGHRLRSQDEPCEWLCSNQMGHMFVEKCDIGLGACDHLRHRRRKQDFLLAEHVRNIRAVRSRASFAPIHAPCVAEPMALLVGAHRDFRPTRWLVEKQGYHATWFLWRQKTRLSNNLVFLRSQNKVMRERRRRSARAVAKPLLLVTRVQGSRRSPFTNDARS